MPPTNAELRDAIKAVCESCTRFRLLLNRASSPQRTAALGTWPWSGRDLDLVDMDEWAAVAIQELDALDGTTAADETQRAC